MGGFAIFEGNDVPHVVTAEELDDLLKNGEIIITERISGTRAEVMRCQRDLF
jgi:hypothetical protein